MDVRQLNFFLFNIKALLLPKTSHISCAYTCGYFVSEGNYTILSSVSLAISKPEEGPERTEEDVEETQKSHCDTELVEDEVNTSSEELNPAEMEGRNKW